MPTSTARSVRSSSQSIRSSKKVRSAGFACVLRCRFRYYVYLTRGSRNAKATSTIRFATAMNNVAKMVTPITDGK